MSQFYAMPYDLDAKGFYFEDEKTYLEKRKHLKNTYGDEVEEFSFEFINGDTIDAELFKALNVDQVFVSYVLYKFHYKQFYTKRPAGYQ